MHFDRQKVHPIIFLFILKGRPFTNVFLRNSFPNASVRLTQPFCLMLNWIRPSVLLFCGHSKASSLTLIHCSSLPACPRAKSGLSRFKTICFRCIKPQEKPLSFQRDDRLTVSFFLQSHREEITQLQAHGGSGETICVYYLHGCSKIEKMVHTAHTRTHIQKPSKSWLEVCNGLDPPRNSRDGVVFKVRTQADETTAART